MKVESDPSPPLWPLRACPSVALVRSASAAFESPAQGISFTLKERIPESSDRNMALVRLAAVLQRGSAPFLNASGVVVDGGGAVRLTLHDPAAAPGLGSGTAAPADATTTPSNWYVEPRLGGEVFQAGVFVVSLSASAEANHSTPDHRLRVGARGRYRHLRLDLGEGQRLQGGVLGGGANVTLAQSLGDGVSVAIAGALDHAPQNNLDIDARVGAGVEWLARSFVDAGAHNYGARYQVGVSHHDYVTVNQSDAAHLTFPTHEAALFWRDHGTSVDLRFELGASAPVLLPEYLSLSGRARLDWRLGGGVELGLRGNVSVRNAALNAPADASNLDRVAQLVAGNDFGQVVYGSELTLSYTFGNTLLAAQDQRWQ